MIEDDIIE